MPAAKKCLNDGKSLKGKRKDAKFCDENCRKAYAKKNNIDMGTGEIKGPGPVAVTGIDKAKPGADKSVVSTYDREKNLNAFIGMGMEAVDFISTGIPELDAFQQIPRGRVTQIHGPYSVGKTTLCLNMIRGLADKKVFYIDSEAALNPYLLVDLGLRADKFEFWNKSAYIEDIYEVVIAAAKSGKYDMIILDSLAACTSRVEAEGEAAARNIGQKPLIVNKLMRIVPMELKNTNTALVIINQERDVIGSYVPQKYTPGGMGPIYAASLIMHLKTIPSWRFPKDAKNGAYKGHEIEVTIVKSKVSQPHRKQKIKLYYVGEQPVSHPDEAVTVPGEF